MAILLSCLISVLGVSYEEKILLCLSLSPASCITDVLEGVHYTYLRTICLLSHLLRTLECNSFCFIVISDLEADNNSFQIIKWMYLGKCSQLGVTACQSGSSLNVLSRFSAYQERAGFPCSKGLRWKKYVKPPWSLC